VLLQDGRDRMAEHTRTHDAMAADILNAFDGGGNAFRGQPHEFDCNNRSPPSARQVLKG